jgi:hypothetical protein
LTIAGTTFTITQALRAHRRARSAPTASSPVGGHHYRDAAGFGGQQRHCPGNAGTVTYRFEVSDVSTFDPARTFAVDAVPQGTNTTNWTLDRDLGPDVLWYWHARATDGVTTSAYSPTETFRTQSSCSYVISPTNLSINSASATATIVVTTASGCAWTAKHGPIHHDSYRREAEPGAAAYSSQFR